MARRRSNSHGRSRRQGGQSSSGLLVLVLLLLILGCGGIGSTLRAIETHPIYGYLTLLALGAFVCVGILVWRRLRQIHGEQARRRHEAYLAHISTLQGLLSLTPTQFEKTIGDLMGFWGYANVRHTGGGGDLAADLICHDQSGHVTVVQCKRYSGGNLVSSPEMQKFIGMIYVHHRAQYGIFVTTSGFTGPARALAQQNGIRIIDGNELVGHIQQWRQAYSLAQVPAQQRM